MKNRIYLLSIILMTLSCSKDDVILLPAELLKPTEMKVCCQSFPNDVLWSVKYEYDNNNLITETILSNGNVQSKTTFEYNANNQLILEIYKAGLLKMEKTFIYNELDQLINIKYVFTNYNNNGEVVSKTESEAPREYENNLLVKEWEHWGGFITYQYKNGKIHIKIDHTKAGKQHHITTFKYSGDLLIEESKETSLGSMMYVKQYKYDSQNRLIKIQDRENIIEENDYIDNKLIEKRTYYFGIDPGFDVCYGKYIYRYKY